MAALFSSGMTAIPLATELNLLDRLFYLVVPTRVPEISLHPLVGLGTGGWLAFGHIVIGLGFIGLLRDPVRNEWLVTWGFLTCFLLLPWAWMFGELRGISWSWRMLDCSFGLGGMIPLFLIYRDLQLMKRETLNKLC